MWYSVTAVRLLLSVNGGTAIWPFLFSMRFSYCLLFIFSFALTCGCSATFPTGLLIRDNNTFVDTDQNLIWQRQKSGLIRKPEEAQRYVNDLNASGEKGWRLPTTAEFHNLYFSFDFGKKNSSKASFGLTGKFWVKNEQGNLVTGAWEDGGGGCCIIRRFLPAEYGSVKAVRNSSAN